MPALLPGTARYTAGGCTLPRYFVGKTPKEEGTLPMLDSDEDRNGASWQVTLLRSYRTGELPDIEGLRLMSFLSPLSECLSDLAKLMLG